MAAKGVGRILLFIMVTVILILFILALIFTINIELHIDNTYWKEKGTDRPIIVIKYDGENGVTYKYSEDCFERYMSLWDLLSKYDYEGVK